jgi:monoamine oxidase
LKNYDFFSCANDVIFPREIFKVKRRSVLKKIGLAASVGSILPSLPGWLSSCKPEDPLPEIQYDGVVAIIGAGAAGLYVGDILQSKGINVKIFEASAKAGGRLKSLRLIDNSPVATDFPIELGAERIIGTDSLWSDIVTKLNIPVIDLNAASDFFILEDQFKDTTAAQADPAFAAAKSFFQNLAGNSGSGSVQQAIQSAGLNSKVHPILNSWIGNKYGTSNSRLGMKGVASGLSTLSRNTDERILKSNPMQDVLISRFSAVVPSIEFNTVIKSVDYSSSKIKLTGEKFVDGVSTGTFSFEADKVIVAVPVSVIKNGNISFVPALPSAKVSALSRIGMDACVRIVLDFKQNFWSSDARFLYGGVQAPEYFNSGTSRSEFNKTLSITVYGEQAEKLSALGRDAAIQAVLQELDKPFAGKATLNIRRGEGGEIVSEYYDWTKDPYIKGGISYVSPAGTIEDRATLAQAVNDVLFFAGEATDDTGEAGTISGALLSAERVAKEVVLTITT